MVIIMGWREVGMGRTESESCSVVSDSLRLEFSSRIPLWSGQPFSSPGDFSNPGAEPRSPTLQVDSLPAEPPGKPKNTGVDSLSLLQWMLPTQEWKWCVLYCRWILYQLSYRELVFNEYRVSGKMKKFQRQKLVGLHNDVNYLMPQNYTLEKQLQWYIVCYVFFTYLFIFVMCFLKPRTFN